MIVSDLILHAYHTWCDFNFQLGEGRNKLRSNENLRVILIFSIMCCMPSINTHGNSYHARTIDSMNILYISLQH